MCLIAYEGPFGASAWLQEGPRSLRRLTVELWDSVARVAAGYAPDGDDLRTLRHATSALRGQAEAIQFIDRKASGAEPRRSVAGLQGLVELVWRAAGQLDVREQLGGDPVNGLEVLAQELDRVLQGDHDAARDLVPLVERLARLAEQSTVRTDNRITV